MNNIVRKIFLIIFSILPLRKNLIIFESNSNFTDSSNCLYEKIKNNKKYKTIWLVTNEKEYRKRRPEVKMASITLENSNPISLIRGLYYRSVAKTAIYTHEFIGNSLRKNQMRVFIPHASPPVKNSTGQFWDVDNNTAIISTSKFAAKYRCKTLRGGEEKIHILGLPRNDLLFGNNNAWNKSLKIATEKCIIWMPTFKHHANKKRIDFETEFKKDISLMTSDNLRILNKKLASINTTLIIKPHPAQDMSAFDIVNMSNIITITNQQLEEEHMQLYELLGGCDALVTDFSSVYFDYLLCNKPIAFELSDKEKYEKGIGFIFENPLDYMPGHKIYSIEDFVRFLDDFSKNKDPYSHEREILKNIVHEYQDNKSTERVLDALGIEYD